MALRKALSIAGYALQFLKLLNNVGIGQTIVLDAVLLPLPPTLGDALAFGIAVFVQPPLRSLPTDQQRSLCLTQTVELDVRVAQKTQLLETLRERLPSG
ncbi:MAG: hypothetical protein V7K89_08065 [Nostoc sp.]|uniref:hypothetical protein n=1 Tax=Nostoc sp. TaxID=1180 RepID=UPI002FF83570